MIWRRIERATERFIADHPEANLGNTLAKFSLCSMGFQVPTHLKYWANQRLPYDKT